MSKRDLIITGVLIFLIMFGFIFKIMIYPLFLANKTVDTAYQITNKTLNANNVIYNYEWFKTQYEAVEAQKDKVVQSEDEYKIFKESLEEDSSKWSKFQQQEESSLRNSLSANRKILTDLISEYNAKASMVNRNIFKGDLPDRLEGDI